MCLRDSKENILGGDKMPLRHTGKPGSVDEPIVASYLSKKEKKRKEKGKYKIKLLLKHTLRNTYIEKRNKEKAISRYRNEKKNNVAHVTIYNEGTKAKIILEL